MALRATVSQERMISRAKKFGIFARKVVPEAGGVHLGLAAKELARPCDQGEVAVKDAR